MRLSKRFLALASAGLMSVAFAQPAAADTILVFGQNGTASTVTGTNAGGATTLTATAVAVTITAIDAAVGTPISAFFSLNALSTGAATLTAGGDITQDFSGSFSITNGGTNYLSGTFSDAVFGSGTGLTLTASSATAGESVNFTSNVITKLGPPRSISLSFTNVQPPASIVNGSLASFTAAVAGNFSAFPETVIPEPASLLLLGSGLAGIAARVRRRRSAAAVN